MEYADSWQDAIPYGTSTDEAWPQPWGQTSWDAPLFAFKEGIRPTPNWALTHSNGAQYSLNKPDIAAAHNAMLDCPAEVITPLLAQVGNTWEQGNPSYSANPNFFMNYTQWSNQAYTVKMSPIKLARFESPADTGTDVHVY